MEIIKGQKYRRISSLVSWYTYGEIYEIFMVKENGVGLIVDDDGDIGTIGSANFSRWELVE